jgi:hypothetical protein
LIDVGVPQVKKLAQFADRERFTVAEGDDNPEIIRL